MTLETGVKELAEAVAGDVKALSEGKVDKEAGKGLSDENYTQAEKTKLSEIAEQATKNRSDSENADKVHDHNMEQVTGLDTVLAGKASSTDPRLTNAREWTATTITQAEAEAGTATTRRAWTAERVRQAANTSIAAQKGKANGIASLDANAKIPLSQLSDSIIGQVEYMGLWAASTNTPTLPATPAQKGHYYVVNSSGTQFGHSFAVGDWIISNGASWDKVDNTDAVSSVNGRTGNVSGLAESNDARFTDSREWSEATVTQAEAEAGTASTRRAWTAQRVRQAINAWWQLVTSGFGRNLVSASNEQAARNVLQLGIPATHSYGAAANTIAQGNDPRIVNGQTAFTWGNHASAGYIKSYVNTTYTASTGLTLTGTAFSVNYGTSAGTAAQGNDSRITGALQSSQVVQVTGTSTTGVMSQKATTDQLATKAPSSHTHPWSQVTGQPAQATRWPTFAEVTDKPASYTPSAHTHPWAQVTGAPATATRWPTPAEVGLLNIGTTAATARAALELTGAWVDLRPYLKPGFYYDSAFNGRNSYPRIRKLSCGRVELDGVVRFNATSGPVQPGVFVNVPAQFRPTLTVGGLMFGDTSNPLSFGAVNWIVTGQVEYSPPRVHGDIMMIPLTLTSPAQNGAISLNGIYWFT